MRKPLIDQIANLVGVPVDQLKSGLDRCPDDVAAVLGHGRTAPDLAGTTHVLMITDMSGSMMPLAADVRGGFNTYLADLAAQPGPYRFTICLFDTEFIPLCVDAPTGDVPRLTAINYMPRGYTALLDAVGKTIAEFDAKTPILPDGDRVLVVIQTDGEENASREYRTDAIRDLIKTREATGKWSFVFLGAGPDAWKQAEGIGIRGTNVIRTNTTGVSTRSVYDGMTKATVAYSRGATGADVSGIVATTPGVSD